MTCTKCKDEIEDAPLVVPMATSGNARYHANRRQCRYAAEMQAGHTWSARHRQRKIQEAMHGSGGSVS